MWGKKLKIGIKCLCQGEKPLLRQLERNKKQRKEGRSTFVLTGPVSSSALTAEPNKSPPAKGAAELAHSRPAWQNRVQRSGFVAREKIA